MGLTFAGQMLDSLDADNSNSVSCAEWQIGKQLATVESLGGGYFGPKKIDPPACKLSKDGAKQLASYNAYLARLTLATIKVNATGLVEETAAKAAHKIDGLVRGNAAVGKAVDAATVLSAKLNATMAG